MEKFYTCDGSKKWSCGACTYLNWPKALRCTQCETARDKKFNLNDYDASESRQDNSTECITDILENLKVSHQDAPHEYQRRKKNENDHRRVLNTSPVENFFDSDYSKSQQLPTNRSPSLETPSKKNSHYAAEAKNEKSPVICQSLDGPYGPKSVFNFEGAESDYSNSFGAYGSRNISPSLVTNSKNSSKSSSYSSGSGAALHGDNTSSDKWTCHVCTYDNWPRAGKCVMCLTSRGRNSSVPRVTSSEDIESSRAGFGSLGGSAPANNRTAHGGNDVSHSGNNRITTSPSNHVLSSGVSNNRRSREIDVRWLEACRGVVEGNIVPVEEYLAAGGDPSRQLTSSEVAMLARPSAFDTGFTLVHLALRFHQENLLATLLSQVDGGPPTVKRVPSYAAPDLAVDIRRHVMSSIRKRKGSFHCLYTTEIVTFTLPSEIEDYAAGIQETLFDEVLDRDVQKELDNGRIINWSTEIMEQLNSRLYALWNRSAGDCLLDSVLQATWGIFDRENGLRQALADSLHDCATMFYQRWKENESLHARLLSFSLNDSQCAADWAKLLSIASKPGSSLEQLHIFGLSHILRRPIIVYGVKYVKSFRGETLGYARYEGLYLPFFWEPSFCWKSPICLGYTRGHFSALVTIDPDCDPMTSVASAAQLGPDDINARCSYLPLTSVDGNLLPIHFLTQADIGKEEVIMNQWLDVRYTDTGIMLARQRIQKPPILVGQMLEEWLNHYRRLGQLGSGPYLRQAAGTLYSSDGESDD